MKTTRLSPVRDALLLLLQHHGDADGMTTAELAGLMGRSTATVNGYLCKLAQYGIVHKIPEQHRGAARPHELNRWKLPERRP